MNARAGALSAPLPSGRERGAFVAVAVALTMAAMTLAPAAAQALIANASAEAPDASGDGPAGWTAESWGEVDATLSWDSAAFDGKRSLKVQVHSAEGEGDARWLSDAATVTEAGSWRIGAFYRSDAPAALLVALYTDLGAKPSWRVVRSVPAATGWSLAEGDVVLPAGVIAVRVAFILAQKGTLRTDGYRCAPSPPPPPALDGDGDVIANGSFEVEDGSIVGAPAGWSFETWGGAVASGSVESGDAADGKRFARITVASVQGEGDGKWLSDPQRVLPDVGDWLLGLRLRGGVRARPAIRQIHSDGSESWQFLPWIAAGPSWQQVRVSFALPSDIDAVRVAVIVGEVGTVDIDAVALHRAGWGGDAFGKLNVSVVVDAEDGALDSALDALAAVGVRGTCFLPSDRVGVVGTTSTTRMKNAEYDGQEIGALGHDVEGWLQADPSAYRGAALQGYAAFDKVGLHVHGFAPPGGAIDDAAIDAVDSREGYVRTLEVGTNYPPYPALDVRVRDVRATTTPAQIATWAEAARRHEGWLVLRYAGVGPAGAVSAERFAADLDMLVELNANVQPVGAMLGLWQRPEPPEQGLFGCSAATGAGTGRGAPPLSPFGLLALAALAVVARRRTAR